ncbi:MAG: hypothetical protein HN472_03735 [Nitrospina sp.]|nr:hypothetical protein [Nitrospina sp.]MBT4048500.1 hypothetical protein [Nitrospina sp.]MBT4558910.1 hypothetical protein [Nitrospina sp.]MBT5348215.1 hypothetical protein [Nitrospina sp.]MBT6738603.1 hypothetical protein [Nitrospina sp.]
MFKVLPESSGDKIKKAFGRLKEIEVGRSDFDDMFLIRGSDEKKIKNLFSKPHVRDFMLNQRRLSLELTPNSLIFSTYLPIGSIDHLKMICDWFSEVLNEICIMDSGYEN